MGHKNFEELKGLTFTSVRQIDSETIEFKGERTFRLTHFQGCCENVYIESIVGELSDLEGEEILVAEEVSSTDGPNLHNDESFTWTFYKLATRNGYVDIRFYGSSNGYYGESADLYELEGD